MPAQRRPAAEERREKDHREQLHRSTADGPRLILDSPGPLPATASATKIRPIAAMLPSWARSATRRRRWAQDAGAHDGAEQDPCAKPPPGARTPPTTSTVACERPADETEGHQRRQQPGPDDRAPTVAEQTRRHEHGDASVNHSDA
jgi:hypothetical protein